MDPIFGLPCTTDSRAMELARSRNHIANKNLARKFEALDLAQRARSGKFLSRWNDLYRQSNTSTPDKGVGKKSTTSMSLEELDKRLHTLKGLKMTTDAVARSRLPFSEDSKVKQSSFHTNIKDTTMSVISIGAFDEGQHIVDLEHRENCLTINRKKHAMREAWDRATSADLQYRKMSWRNSSQDLMPSRSLKAKSQERQDSDKTSSKSVNKSRQSDPVARQ